MAKKCPNCNSKNTWLYMGGNDPATPGYYKCGNCGDLFK